MKELALPLLSNTIRDEKAHSKHAKSEEGEDDEPSALVGLFQAISILCVVLFVYILPLKVVGPLFGLHDDGHDVPDGDKFIGCVGLLLGTIVGGVSIPLLYESMFLPLVRLIGGSTKVDYWVAYSTKGKAGKICYKIDEKWYTFDGTKPKGQSDGIWTSIFEPGGIWLRDVPHTRRRLDVWSLNTARPFFLDTNDWNSGNTTRASGNHARAAGVKHPRPVPIADPHKLTNKPTRRRRAKTPLQALQIRLSEAVEAVEPTCTRFFECAGYALLGFLFIGMVGFTIVIIGAFCIFPFVLSVLWISGASPSYYKEFSWPVLLGAAWFVQACWQVGGWLCVWFFIVEKAQPGQDGDEIISFILKDGVDVGNKNNAKSYYFFEKGG